MRKFFAFLGVVFAVMVVIIAIAAVIFIPRALKLDRGATGYIQDAVPKIVAHWNSKDLTDRATPELLASAKSTANLDRLFAMFQQLGALQHLDTPEGNVGTQAFTGSGVITLGTYTVKATFDKGPATIRIQLRLINGEWKVNGFYINSDIFLPSKS